uniref:DNA polymerase n=1 Tax=Pseudomonas phage HRDY3 TaxID=3236930 RepID=A0AB39CDH1_9VIRU
MKPKTDMKNEPITFATLYRASKYKSDGTFCQALSKLGADKLDAYDFYISGEPRKILDIEASDLDALQSLVSVGTDVYGLYTRALIAFNLSKEGANTLKELRARFRSRTVKSWLDQHQTPSAQTLAVLRDEFGIDVLANSVVDTPAFAARVANEKTQAKTVKDTTAVETEVPAVNEKQPKQQKVQGKKPAVKKAAYTLADVWTEHHSDLANYCAATFRSNEIPTYTELADGDIGAVIAFSPEMLIAMQDKHPKQDIEKLYRRALVKNGMANLDHKEIAVVTDLYGSREIESWTLGTAVPDDDQLEEMAERGIYLVQYSVLDIDEDYQPAIQAKPRGAYVEGDEIFDHFDKRDLDRVVHLSDDYTKISDAGYDDQEYGLLVKTPAFRAMMELWPASFRHGYVEDTDQEPRWWTLQTECFKARVSDVRAEIEVASGAGGYTMWARVENLEEAVAHVFSYFDVLSSDQLGEILHDQLGFENEHVAGVEFDVAAKSNFTPDAFFDSEYHNEIQIRGNGQWLNAKTFLLLAAQTVRGVVFDQASTYDRYEAYDVHVGENAVHAMYFNNRAPDAVQEGPRKGAASAHEHELLLAKGLGAQLHKHGVYVAGNVMQLPLSVEAQAMFHANNTEAVHKFMDAITFI